MDGKQLKNSILQWAIQGKLVPQNPKDEPAQKLLERIAVARNEYSAVFACHPERSAKGTKSKDLKKKTSKNPPSRIYRENGVWYEQVGTAAPKDISDEIPFEIPENWEWVRLPMVGELNRGKSQARPRNDPSLFSNGTFPMIQTGDVARAETVISSCKSKYNEKGIAQSRIWPKGTICLTIAANIGDVAILGFDACFPDSVVGFNAYTPIDSNLFFLYALKCYKNILDELSRSTAQKNINIDILSKIFFPLPPLAEQKRIVAKLEQVLPLAEEYGSAQEQLDKLNKELPEALKKSILQEAIQGKLVPQNPKDEPASVLLAKIRKEKESLVKQGKLKKKDLESTQINEEEIPFELPMGWVWARFEDLSLDSADGPFGSNLKKEHYTDKKEVRIIQLSNIGEDGWRDLNTKYTSFEHLKNISRCEAFPGDIIVAKMMPAGRAIICPDMDKKYALSSDAVRFDFSNLLYKKYLYWAINSTVVKDQVYSEVQGITRVRTSLSKLRTYLIPIPPLAEQKRIVAKLEQLFKVL